MKDNWTTLVIIAIAAFALIKLAGAQSRNIPSSGEAVNPPIIADPTLPGGQK